ncbi:MAG: nuclear transport factor 2 family protein [Kangiellaceae bacterium]|nr:nuclear transport factor 2 family protein [Kangiellaceae bacterium]
MLNERVDNYLDVIESIDNTKEISDPAKRFTSLFGDLKKGANENTIKQLYAADFYFNDTFKTIKNIDELVSYMEETSKAVDVTTVDILDVSKSQTDYYLRWVMHMQFTAKGKKVDSRSIGVTQIRFNEQGKVILHQDYWDGAEGFYQHLPFVGYIIRKVRDSL